MNSDYSPRSGSRRPRRRGGRSNGGRPRSGERRGERSNREETHNGQARPSGGLFDKIKGFFGLGKGKKQSQSQGEQRPSGERSTHPTVRRAEEQRNGQRAERAERPARQHAPKPELEAANPDAVTNPRLYIGNLSYDTAESDLFDLFGKSGTVKNVELVRDRRTNRSKGFGFVEMADIETAKKAVVAIHRSEFMGRQIVVSGAKSERRETPAVEPEPQQPEEPQAPQAE
ncbi:MAG: hypothetical protein PW734_05235 [Verrucomicrobium sp.]|nr:hypothetical protein [Verrucomicrobium sp.]